MPNIEKIPPHNNDAEISTLGAVLLDSNVFGDVAEIIGADDFYAESHKEIFRAMLDLQAKGEPVDIVTVCDQLTKQHRLEAVGGRSYIAELVGAVPTSANVKEYAKIIAEKAVLRRLISASGNIVQNCYSEELESGKVLDEAERQIFDIAKGRQTKDMVQLKEVLGNNLQSIAEAAKNGGIVQGLPTGFIDLDNKTTGLQKSDMIIIAARPSMGKTAFALNIAQYAAIKRNKHVAIFSLEMSKEQLGLRLLAMQSRVDSKKLKTGQLSAEDWENIQDAISEMGQADIFIDDTPGISVMDIRNKCRRLTQGINGKPLDLILIDYLQLMSSSGQSESRQQEVSKISGYLKQLAREMECPVIVLSQLSRAVEQRQGKDKRPIMSDIRESGAIEQDADIVMFLYREDYYKKDLPPEKQNKCEIIIAKNRNGEIGSVTLGWLPKFTKFTNIQHDESSMPPMPSEPEEPEETYEQQEI